MIIFRKPGRFQSRLPRGEGTVFALVGEWCGRDAREEFSEVLAPREEVARLQEMVKDLARWLRDSGHPVKAALVLKDLERTQASE